MEIELHTNLFVEDDGLAFQQSIVTKHIARLGIEIEARSRASGVIRRRSSVRTWGFPGSEKPGRSTSSTVRPTASVAGLEAARERVVARLVGEAQVV